MQTQIDWLSFSFPIGAETHPENGWKADDVMSELRRYTGDGLRELFETDEVKHEGGRAPYAHSIALRGGILAIYWGGRLNHGLVQIHGQGMAFVREKQIERDLLLIAAERVTRIDLATDISSSTRPIEFVQQRSSTRHQAHASMHSKSGETEYVGGRTSNRFARVYRYCLPHPRAHLLRVEHEVKGELAKKVVPEILSMGVETVQERLGLSFGWQHPDWQPVHQNLTKVKGIPNDRTAARTEIWLRTQAASAFHKLVKSGIIEQPELWLKEVFLDSLYPNAQDD